MPNETNYEPSRLHNNPPGLKSGIELKESLETDHAELVSRNNEMLTMADDFHADHASVEDDETSGVLAGVIRQILSQAKAAVQTHAGVKDPYLTSTRIIDNFFLGGMKTPLESAAAELNKKQTAYQRAKEDRRRREAEEAARVAREAEDARRREAEKAERELQRAQREARRAQDAEVAADARLRAEQADKRAQEARAAEEAARVEREAQQRTSGASAADLSRVRGDYAMASLKTTWEFSIEDITKVPAEYLQVNSAMVKAAIRGKDGKRDIPGLHIFSVKTAANR